MRRVPRVAIGGILGAGLLFGCGSPERSEEFDDPAGSLGQTSASTDHVRELGRSPGARPERVADPEREPAIIATGPPSAGPPSAGPPSAEPLSAEPLSTKKPILELAFVGDIVLGEYVYADHRSFAGPLAADPFERASESLSADLLVGNLESPVMEQVPKDSPIRYGHRFAGSAAAVDTLAEAGFDVMSLANNHANDLAREGLRQSPALLRARGIVPVGEARAEGSPFVVETVVREGWRIGFVAATTWLNHWPTPGDPAVPLMRTSGLSDALVPLVIEAREDHDLVVVLLHWGRERREKPGPPQLHAAHDLVEAGADLVIGHHPHVLQGIEHHGEGLIAYSLGNFLFPARYHEYRDTAVLRVRWRARPRCWADAVIEPMRLDRAPTHAPRPTTPRERRVIVERMQRLGQGLGTRWRERDDRLVLEGCATKTRRLSPGLGTEQDLPRSQ